MISLKGLGLVWGRSGHDWVAKMIVRKSLKNRFVDIFISRGGFKNGIFPLEANFGTCVQCVKLAYNFGVRYSISGTTGLTRILARFMKVGGRILGILFFKGVGIINSDYKYKHVFTY